MRAGWLRSLFFNVDFLSQYRLYCLWVFFFAVVWYTFYRQGSRWQFLHSEQASFQNVKHLLTEFESVNVHLDTAVLSRSATTAALLYILVGTFILLYY